jgi:uncharacterized membrane protein
MEPLSLLLIAVLGIGLPVGAIMGMVALARTRRLGERISDLEDTCKLLRHQLSRIAAGKVAPVVQDAREATAPVRVLTPVSPVATAKEADLRHAEAVQPTAAPQPDQAPVVAQLTEAKRAATVTEAVQASARADARPAGQEASPSELVAFAGDHGIARTPGQALDLADAPGTLPDQQQASTTPAQSAPPGIPADNPRIASSSVGPSTGAEPGDGPAPRADDPRAAEADARPAFDPMEALLGKRLMTWVGVGILFLGLAFFVKYAYDQDWLGHVFGPRARLATVAGIGLALMIWGWRTLRAGMTSLGQGALGGGLAMLYLGIYAAVTPALMVVPEPLLSTGAAFALMALVTALGVAIAVWCDALAISVLAVLGGFATPVLLAGGGDHRDTLFTYLLVLDLGVLAVAVVRQWRALDPLTFAGTVLLFAGWYREHAPAPAPEWPTLLWMLAFYTLFLLLPFAFHWRTRTPVTVARFALALGALAWFTGYAADLLHGPCDALLGAICALLAGAHLALGLASQRRVPTDRKVLHGFIALAALLLTLALVFLLPVDGIATAWMAEAVVLLLFGWRYAYAPTRWAAAAVLALGLVRLAFFTLVPVLSLLPHGTPLANRWFITLVAGSAAMGAFACVHRRWRAGATAWDVLAMRVAGGGAALWLLVAGQAELVRSTAQAEQAVRATMGGPSLLQTLATSSSPAAAASVWGPGGVLMPSAWWWLGGALALGWWARRTRCAWLQSTGFPPWLVGMGCALAWYTLSDRSGWPAANPRCATALVGAVILLLGAWSRGPLVLGAAQLLVLLVATLETAAWTQTASAPATPHLALAAVWLGCALGSALTARALGRSVFAKIAILPLALGVAAALSLYVRAMPGPLFSNGRFLVGVLAVVATAVCGRCLAGCLPEALRAAWRDRTVQVVQGGVMLLVSLETVVWCVDHLSGDEALRWSAWSLLATWSATAVVSAWLCGLLPALRTGGRSAQLASLGPLIVLLIAGWSATWMVVNLRFLLAAAVVAGLGVAASRRPPGQRRTLAALAISCGLAAVTVEPAQWFLANIADAALAGRLATFSITVVWTLAATGLLVAGFRCHQRPLRFVALGLFALVAIKLLAVDMAKAQQLYRILAFCLVGVLLMAASWGYHRMERRWMRDREAP